MKLKTWRQLKFCYAIILLSIILYLMRPFFSVEITDEVFAVSEIYNFSQGNIPFMDVWTAQTGAWFFTPFLSLYMYLNGGLDGVVLYFRILYVIVAFSLVIITYYCLKHQTVYDDKIPFYTLVPILLLVPYSTFMWSYNYFLSYSHYLAAVLLFTINNNEREYGKYCLMGSIMGIGCCGYPPMIISAFLLAVPIYWKHRRTYGKYQMMAYLVSGMTIGSLFLLYIFSHGSLEQFSLAWEAIMHSPHEEGKVFGLKGILQIFVKPFLSKDLFFIYLLVVCGVVWHWRKTDSFFRYCWYLLFAIWLCTYSTHPMYVSLVILVSITFCYYLCSKRRFVENMGMSVLTFVLGVLVYCISSDNMSIIVAIGVLGSLAMFLSIIYWWQMYREEILTEKIFHIGLAMLCLSVLSSYTYVYRDVHPWQVEAKVESGIYKGLYTTNARKQYVETVEKFVNFNVAHEDKICTTCLAPYVYLMAEAKCFTPWTWDSQFLARGKKNAKPLISWFEAKGELPDVFIGVSWKGYEYPNDAIEINRFMNENGYRLVAEDYINGERIWCWRR